jgi:hypothetical protein
MAIPVTAAAAERRVALVIGNAAYRSVAPLANTVNDANGMAAVFKSAGFDVVLRKDLGVLEFKRAVREFMATVRDADIAVVYYAGHGLEAGGINYLVPVDAKLLSDYDAEDEAVSLDRVILALQQARRLRLIILDACRDNPFLQKLQRTIATRALTNGLAKVEPGETDTLIAYAAKAGSVSSDGTGAHSPFTAALMKHLTEPGVDIRIALGKVRDEVLKATGGRQEPFVYGSLGGETVSLVPIPEPKTARTTADPNLDIRIDYEMAERVGTSEGWESFLAIHGSGYYADLARAQLAKLKATTPATPPATVPVKQEAVPVVLERAPTEHPAVKPKPEIGLHTPAEPERLPPRQHDAKVEPGRPEEACRHDAERLAHLRADPQREEVVRFAHDLSCEELRPQLQRLLESVAAPAPGTPQPELIHSAMPGRTAAPPAPASAGRQPAADLNRRAPATAKAVQTEACRRDAEQLDLVRANPTREGALRLSRELACDDLREQVARLLESIE